MKSTSPTWTGRKRSSAEARTRRRPANRPAVSFGTKGGWQAFDDPRIFLCTRRADLRKSFDGLAQLVREHLGTDPLSGHLFVFCNKRGDRLKLLYWDEDGYAIWYKRLEVGTFDLAGANAARPAAGEHGVTLRPAELAMLLEGIDLSNVKRRKRYQRPTATAS